MTSTVEFINIQNLLFDHQNPRLSEFGITEDTSQDEILTQLWELMGAEEIYLSIAASGFFQHEPLIIIPSKIPGKYCVIEGNRRLAAVKAILTPGLIEKYGSTPNLPPISKEIKAQLENLPCIQTTRKDSWRFVGFKHVNGPAKWGSYAKAQFIAQVKQEYGLSISEIAKQIGDTTKIASKLFQAFMVLEQAEKEKIFNRDDIYSKRLFFSHLYNGLNHENIKKFIGLKDFDENIETLVPNDKLPELEELLGWMFGSKKNGIKPLVVSQNPDLKHLSESLSNSASIAALRATNNLEAAFELSLTDSFKFGQSLNDASRAIYNVQKYLITGYDGKSKELLQTAKNIADLTDSIFNVMKAKYESSLPSQETKTKRIID